MALLLLTSALVTRCTDAMDVYTPYTHTRRDDMLASIVRTKNGNLINLTQFKIQIFLCNCRNLRQIHLIQSW